jgi:hypothetical protein
MDSDVFICATI